MTFDAPSGREWAIVTLNTRGQTNTFERETLLAAYGVCDLNVTFTPIGEDGQGEVTGPGWGKGDWARVDDKHVSVVDGYYRSLQMVKRSADAERQGAHPDTCLLHF